MPDKPTRAANIDRVRNVLPFAGPDLDSVIEQLDDRGLEVLAALVEAPAMVEQGLRARAALELAQLVPEEGGPFDGKRGPLNLCPLGHVLEADGSHSYPHEYDVHAFQSQTPQGPGLTR